MATQFLRKIILEELQKALKEEEIPGSEPGQTKSPYVKNKDRELDLGDTTFTVKKKAISPSASKECKSEGGALGQGMSLGCRGTEVKAFQYYINYALTSSGNLDEASSYAIVPDGIYGPKTQKAVQYLQKKVGIQGDGSKVDPNTYTGINMFAMNTSKNAAQECRRMVVSGVLEPQYAKIQAALKLPSATPSGEEKAGPSGTPSGLPQDVMTPKERKKALEVQPLKGESIAREINKLLRSI